MKLFLNSTQNAHYLRIKEGTFCHYIQTNQQDHFILSTTKSKRIITIKYTISFTLISADACFMYPGRANICTFHPEEKETF
jgi:hypothetical protein